MIVCFYYQLDAQILYFCTFIYTPLHVSSTIVLIFKRKIILVQNLVLSLSSDDRSIHRLRQES